jgi:hypothetical protein
MMTPYDTTIIKEYPHPHLYTHGTHTKKTTINKFTNVNKKI